MGAYKDVGKRLREQLLARGYRRADGEPDVQRFAWDFRFDKGHVYGWLRDEMTPFKELVRLCVALDCSERWLLTGYELAAKKATPASGRQHKGLRSLLLGLIVGSGLWPSPSGSGPSLSPTESVRTSVSRDYVKRRFRLSLGTAYA